MIQRLVTILVILLIVLGGGYYAYKQLVPPPEEEATGPVYATKPVIRGDITVGVEVTGQLNPSSGGSIQVPGNRYSGTSATYTIKESFIQEGDIVKQGQLLVRLEAPDLQTQIDGKQAELAAERKSLAELMNVPVDQVDYIDPARGITLYSPIAGRVTGLTVKEGDKLERGLIVARVVNDSKFRITAKLLPGELENVEVGDEVLLSFPDFSGYVRAKVVDINPNLITEKASDLYDSVTGGRGSGDQYVFVHWVTLEGDNPGLVQPDMIAKIGLAKEKRQALNEYNARWLRYMAVVDGYAEEERVLSSTDAIITRIFVSNMQLVEKGEPLISLAGEDALNLIQEKLAKIRAIQLEIQQLYNQFSALEITAPMDGIVSYIDAMPGRTVQPGDWIGHIYIAKDMRLGTEIDDIDILLVQQGAHVDITVDALPGEVFAGEVLNVSTIGWGADGGARFYAEIKVSGSDELRPGMQARGFINAGSAKDVLLAPIEAVFEDDGQSKVEVLEEDGTIRLVPVKLGLMDSMYAEVMGGLKEGEQVITGSTADLLPSRSIRSNESILPERPDKPEEE
ncbi:MAG: HlyD family efflux transporter periplasmic adaptor subunit [Bacillota bacterium]|nr:HlyD family efflux transporter periplasmic adaptor subunit [Bacillota bacterium]HHU29826.1 HlyD family efflux transporter periplasmic adaptor subunit [Bacillota bacterium]